MSIIAKGMKMPKSCGRCWFNNSSLSCAVTGSCIDRDDENREKLDDCPLVDLGKHGRLIDADALDYRLGSSDRDIYVKYTVEEEPTVIEAEDE